MLDRRTFAGKDALATALSEAIAGDLAAGIAERGAASLAVSGGSTPARMFAALGARSDLDWDKVTVTLVDERWVDQSSDRSNARLVKQKLLQGPAAAAKFVPLYHSEPNPDLTAIAKTDAALNLVPSPFDAVILGMGNDGHTASFFPDGDTLTEALTAHGPVVAIEAPGAGEPRVTLTLKRLLQTRSLYLHIEGEDKEKVLEKALGQGPVEEMPVRAVLRQTQKPVIVFWCP
jgi:6-phosphogluconolactonase